MILYNFAHIDKFSIKLVQLSTIILFLEKKILLKLRWKNIVIEIDHETTDYENKIIIDIHGQLKNVIVIKKN